MNWEEIFKIIVAALGSIGGGGALVLALSSYLGKIWANRIFEQEKTKYAQEIEKLKMELQLKVNQSGLLFKQKIELYQKVSEPIISLLVEATASGELKKEKLIGFEKNRLEVTALLGMFAPSLVFDEFNIMIDYVYDCFDGKEAYSFDLFRQKAINFLNEVRKDLGVYSDEISYTGTR